MHFDTPDLRELAASDDIVDSAAGIPRP